MENRDLQGYLHPYYPESFRELGTPQYLPKSGGWVIKRQIPGTGLYDAMGPYPMFFCQNWDALPNELEELEGIVSISLVIGPFADLPTTRYKNCFDIFRFYKNHYILDFNQPLEQAINKRRINYALHALKIVSVDCITAPKIDLDEWVQLYDDLIQRHNITGIRRFSREGFANQIAIPGTHFFRARIADRIIGGNLFYVQDNIAYGHLLALTEEGYRMGASDAIKWIALNYFSTRVKSVSFGGSTGSEDGNLTGLDKYKMSWSNRTAPAYFCAKIIEHPIYKELTKESTIIKNDWFPKYRSNDF